MTQSALIIGASRGLGFGLVRELRSRGWDVTGTVRGTGRAQLQALGSAVETVDINKPAEVAALRERLADRRFDLVFVNAGVSNDRAETVATVSDETFVEVMITNALSPMRVIETLGPLSTGAIGAMSSGLGSVADNEAGEWEVYRASKAALNTLMRSYAARHRGDTRTLFVIAPGWVRTDMGGPEARYDVATSMRGVVDAMLSRWGQPGLHYVNHQGNTVRW